MGYVHQYWWRGEVNFFCISCPTLIPQAKIECIWAWVQLYAKIGALLIITTTDDLRHGWSLHTGSYAMPQYYNACTYSLFHEWKEDDWDIRSANVILELHVEDDFTSPFCKHYMIEKYTIMLLVIIVVQASLAVRRTSKDRLMKQSLTLTDSLHPILRAEDRTTDPNHTVRRRSHRNGDNIGPSHSQAWLQSELCGHWITTYK